MSSNYAATNATRKNQSTK